MASAGFENRFRFFDGECAFFAENVVESRLRAMLWRAFAYPLAVLAGLALVLIFLGLIVIPQFVHLFDSFKVNVPPVTRMPLSPPATPSAKLPPWPVTLIAPVAVWTMAPFLSKTPPVLKCGSALLFAAP